ALRVARAIIDYVGRRHVVTLRHLVGDELVDGGGYQAMRQQAALSEPPVASAYPYPGIVYFAEKLMSVVGQLRALGFRRPIRDGQVDEVVSVIYIGGVAHHQGEREHAKRIVRRERSPQLSEIHRALIAPLPGHPRQPC